MEMNKRIERRKEKEEKKNTAMIIKALNYCVIAVNCLQNSGLFFLFCVYFALLFLGYDNTLCRAIPTITIQCYLRASTLFPFIPLSLSLLDSCWVIVYTLLRRRGELGYHRRQENIYFAFELCIDFGFFFLLSLSSFLFHSFRSVFGCSLYNCCCN